MSSYLGGGRPPENVWVEPQAHRRSAGRPSHIKFFAPIGTRFPRSESYSLATSCIDHKMHWHRLSNMANLQGQFVLSVYRCLISLYTFCSKVIISTSSLLILMWSSAMSHKPSSGQICFLLILRSRHINSIKTEVPIVNFSYFFPHKAMFVFFLNCNKPWKIQFPN